MVYKFDKDIGECNILSIGTNAPPRFKGGLDQSMWSLATQLVGTAKEVNLLACVDTADEEYDDVIQGVNVFRRHFPRPYPATEHGKPFIQKISFQISDHLGLRNEEIFSDFFELVLPDIVLVHSLVGIGFNIVNQLIQRDVRVVFYLHELGLVCLNRAMFRNGSVCTRQCLPCVFSSRYQQSLHDKLRHVAYVSPSNSNLLKVQEFFRIRENSGHSVLNANAYPPATANKNLRVSAEAEFTFTFVGRIDREKGVAFILEVFSALSQLVNIFVNIVGDGAELPSLRAQYGDHAWCQFHGWMSQEDISNILINSDALVAPSLWSENSPGVVAHSLSLGVPVIASRVGGMLDLVSDQVNGLLAAVGDRADWLQIFEQVCKDRILLNRLRSNAAKMAPDLSAHNIFKKHLAVMDSTRN